MSDTKTKTVKLTELEIRMIDTALSRQYDLIKGRQAKLRRSDAADGSSAKEWDAAYQEQMNTIKSAMNAVLRKS